MAIRLGLLREVVVMAFDTVRTNKMRSALTVLGVVIGITSIVGMTSMIRGFDQSLRDMIGAIGPNTIFIQRFNVTNFANGAELRELFKRPNLTISDARAIEEQTEAIRLVDVELGAGGPPTQRRVFYRDQKTRPMVVLGTSENFEEGTQVPMLSGRFFNGTEVQYRTNVVVIGNTPYQVLFAPSGIDPIGKLIRVGNERFEVIGVFDKRPAAGGFNLGQDDFVVIPYTAYQRVVWAARCDGWARRNRRRDSADSNRHAAAGGRVPSRRHRRRRARHAHPPRSAAGRAERLRDPHAGRGAQTVGPDQPGHVPRARGHVVDCVDGRRHRGHGHHVDLGHRTHARDRRPESAGCPPGRNSVPVPDGSRVSDVARRRARHSASAAQSAGPFTWCRASRFRFPGGRSPSVSASPPRSASSSGCTPPSKPLASIRSKPSATNNQLHGCAGARCAGHLMRLVHLVHASAAAI